MTPKITKRTYIRILYYKTGIFQNLPIGFIEQDTNGFVQRDLPISKNICCHIITYYKKGGHRASRAPSPIYKFKVL